MASTMTVKNMEKDDLDGVTAAYSQAHSTITISREREHMNGTMEEDMKVTGRTIKWTDMEFSLGLMAEDMRESIGEI